MSANPSGFQTCAVLDNGHLKCWGNNMWGQLGLGDTINRGVSPGQMGDALPAVSLGTGRTAVAVSSGRDYVCALLDDGSIRCWGGNSNGVLGMGDTAFRGLSASTMGDALPAVSLGTGRTAVALAVGSDHSCALLDNGSIKCWYVALPAYLHACMPSCLPACMHA